MKYRTHRDELSTCLIALLLTTFILVTGNAPAQAHGPAAKKIQQNGRPTISASDSRDLIGQFEFARHQQQRLELRAAETIAEQWVARLEGGTAKSIELVSCHSQRCFKSFEVSAERGSDMVSIVVSDGPYKVNLTMYRDEQAH